MKQKTTNRPKRKYPCQTMGKKEQKLIHRRCSGATQTILPQVALGFGFETQAAPSGGEKNSRIWEPERVELWPSQTNTLQISE